MLRDFSAFIKAFIKTFIDNAKNTEEMKTCQSINMSYEWLSTPTSRFIHRFN